MSTQSKALGYGCSLHKLKERGSKHRVLIDQLLQQVFQKHLQRMYSMCMVDDLGEMQGIVPGSKTCHAQNATYQVSRVLVLMHGDSSHQQQTMLGP